MKKLMLLTIIASMLSLSAYSELTVEDYEKIQNLLKEQTAELTKQFKAEIKASEERTREYINLNLLIIEQKLETNYVRVQAAERVLITGISVIGILLGSIAIPLAIAIWQNTKANRNNQAATPPISTPTTEKPQENT